MIACGGLALCAISRYNEVMECDFEWDPRKAADNATKHGVTIELSSTVFRDPRALSAFDTDHSKSEDRWLTLGVCSTGILLVVHHTFTQVDEDRAIIRIISSRKATKREQLQYVE